MHSAFILTELRYPAMPLVGQLDHKRFVHPGPLVLRTGPLKSPPPTTDRDRTVSRRSEPSSRTALIGEQPNPWNLLQLQDAMSRHRVPNLVVDVNSWTRSACYPRGSFYPLSDGPPTRYYRITLSDFRPCPACRPCSQARFCQCTLWAITMRPERTLERLRYRLGGDRPSQTARLSRSLGRITAVG